MLGRQRRNGNSIFSLFKEICKIFGEKEAFELVIGKRIISTVLMIDIVLKISDMVEILYVKISLGTL